VSGPAVGSDTFFFIADISEFNCSLWQEAEKMSSIPDVIMPQTTWFAEQKRRFPRPDELLSNPWPRTLFYRKGKDRLKNLPVYYDFDWQSVFNHERNTFPHGQSLAELVRKESPDDKYPALLLTIGDDVEECPIITDTHYIVVVNINKYLDQSSADSAISYFARITKSRITGLSNLKEVVSSPEGLEIILPFLNGEIINKWSTGNSELLHELAKISATSGFQELLDVLTIDDLILIFDWAAAPGNNGQAREIVNRLREESLPTLYTLTGIARLKKALTLWEVDRYNDDEEFWQHMFSENTFLLSQLFSYPVIILKGKAYVGGKGIENTGGNIVDYLMANEFTRNALLIEIKTPMTPLLGSLYRDNIYNISSDLSGAVQQLSNYRHELIQNYHTLEKSSSQRFFAFNPPSLVIAGNIQDIDKNEGVKSLELYRNELRNIKVITFDELFNKLRILVNLLEGVSDSSA
jgi:hypothetical protein